MKRNAGSPQEYSSIGVQVRRDSDFGHVGDIEKRIFTGICG